MNTERLQPYFDDGIEVYRAAPGVDPTTPRATQSPPPFFVCKADSKKQAQRIANAMNQHVPLKERKAVERNLRAQKVVNNFSHRSGKPEPH
jgi:hypothetical protein